MVDVKRMLTDPDRRSVAARARDRRFRVFLDRFPDLAEMRVLDLGGEVHTWTLATTRPAHVTLLNLGAKFGKVDEYMGSGDVQDWMSAVEGDACAPPAEIRAERFDLVYSNSVFEHVGGHQPRRHFAYWAQTLGEHHWIQTPNRFFALEPHWLAPGFQFAPPRLQGALLRHWPGASAYYRDDPWYERIQRAMSIELLSPGAFRSYFPESDFVTERVLGMAKSLIAVR